MSATATANRCVFTIHIVLAHYVHIAVLYIVFAVLRRHVIEQKSSICYVIKTKNHFSINVERVESRDHRQILAVVSVALIVCDGEKCSLLIAYTDTLKCIELAYLSLPLSVRLSLHLSLSLFCTLSKNEVKH